MKAVGVVSQKGGVGKTTVALNLALAMAKAGWRTVLVDTDPQGAVGHSLVKARASGGLVAYVSGRASLDAALVSTRLPELHILPIGPLQARDTIGFSDYVADGQAFAGLCAELAEAADVLLFDTPCGFGGVTMGVLRACDGVLSPLQAEPIALRTLPQLLDVIAALHEEGLKVRLIGVVLTMLQVKNDTSLDVAQEAWGRLPDDLVLDASVPRDPAFLRASGAGVPIGMLSRRPPPVARVFDQMVQELEERLPLERVDEGDEPLDLFA